MTVLCVVEGVDVACGAIGDEADVNGDTGVGTEVGMVAAAGDDGVWCLVLLLLRLVLVLLWR